MLEGAFMDAMWLSMLIGGLFVLIVGLFIRLEMCHRGIISMAESLRTAFKQDVKALQAEHDDNFIEDLKDEVLEMIGTMRPPTIADHLGGVLQQFAQMRLMKMMRDENLNLPIMTDDEVV